jgi:hypothetical protein
VKAGDANNGHVLPVRHQANCKSHHREGEHRHCGHHSKLVCLTGDEGVIVTERPYHPECEHALEEQDHAPEEAPGTGRRNLHMNKLQPPTGQTLVKSCNCSQEAAALLSIPSSLLDTVDSELDRGRHLRILSRRHTRKPSFGHAPIWIALVNSCTA